MADVGWNEWLSMMASLAVVLVLLAATLFGAEKNGLAMTKPLLEARNCSARSAQPRVRDKN